MTKTNIKTKTNEKNTHKDKNKYMENEKYIDINSDDTKTIKYTQTKTNRYLNLCSII